MKFGHFPTLVCLLCPFIRFSVVITVQFGSIVRKILNEIFGSL